MADMQEAGGQLLPLDFLLWRDRAGLSWLGFTQGSGTSLVPSSAAARLVVTSVSAEIADTAEETAAAKSDTLSKFLLVLLPPVGPAPCSLPGFLSCQCLPLLAGEILAY